MCRTFLTRAYPTMKKNNPDTPIMMREAAGTLPRIYARYGPSPSPPCGRHGGLTCRRETPFGPARVDF